MISILVVTWNSAPEVGPCLSAALAQEVDGQDIEIVVVDNGSSDETLERLRPLAEAGRLDVVDLGRNTGFAHGVNAAFARSRGEWILLLNPDCAMDPGCVAALYAHLTEPSGAKVGVAAANLRDPDGTQQLFARRDLTVRSLVWMTEAGRRVDRRLRGYAGRARRRYDAQMKPGLSEPMEVFAAAAACILIPRHCLEPQPLDEQFPLFFNDTDLYRRLGRLGWRCEVVPSATAVHGYGVSVAKADDARVRGDYAASLVRYVSNDWSRPRVVAVWALLALDGLSAAVIGRLRRSPMATDHGRGTLGGLGLPGGARPWLAHPEPFVRALRRQHPARRQKQ